MGICFKASLSWRWEPVSTTPSQCWDHSVLNLYMSCECCHRLSKDICMSVPLNLKGTHSFVSSITSGLHFFNLSAFYTAYVLRPEGRIQSHLGLSAPKSLILTHCPSGSPYYFPSTVRISLSDEGHERHLSISITIYF